MKQKSFVLSVAAACSFFTVVNPAVGQGTAFTYQGRLNDGGNLANGSYDLRFILYDNGTTGPTQQGPILTNSATAVSNGLFTVVLDFGNQFPGAARWLEIGVRTNGGGAFITLSPQHQLTPTPYAITTGNVISGGLASGAYNNAVTFNNAADQFAGAFTGDGANVTNVNAVTLGGLTANQFWKTSGNGGTVAGSNYLGTSDLQPLELKVNGGRALRIEPNSAGAPNIIGGASANAVGAGIVGAVIGGGGATNYFGFYSYTNRIDADFGTIAGGIDNHIQTYALYCTIGGGQNNLIQTNSNYSFIGGGLDNVIGTNALYSTVGGGVGNVLQANSVNSTIAGGMFNNIQDSAFDSTIAGGHANTIQADASDSTVGGGINNSIQSNSLFSTIGGGTNNHVQPYAYFSTIAGGDNNTINRDIVHSTVGGGGYNLIEGVNTVGATIAGGIYNDLYGSGATIGGGNYNTNTGSSSTIAGGFYNIIDSSDYSTIGGGVDNSILRREGGFGSQRCTIGGGERNTNFGSYATVPGGYENVATNFCFAAGNRAKALYDGSFVWADSQNADFASTANNQFLIRADGGVGIGLTNPAAALHVVSSNGVLFQISQAFSNPLLGTADLRMNVIGFPYWEIEVGSGQFPALNFNSQQRNQLMRLDFNGNLTTAGTVNGVSDRNAKEKFTAVSSREMLDKVAALPISEWNFKHEPQTRHIGPMAQDFYAAFNVGMDDKHIATVDEGGVALAAIQGLNQKLTEELERRDAENAELKQRLEILERTILKLK